LDRAEVGFDAMTSGTDPGHGRLDRAIRVVSDDRI